VAELGCAPFEVGRQREISAEALAIPVIQDYYRRKPPATVRQAIQRYREAYPLSFAVSDTQRIFASDLDAELPKVAFADWFERIVGPDAGVTWQLSECGERGEDSLRATGDIRACVSANSILRDGRGVIVMIAVGTFKRGIVGAPRFDFAVVERKGELYAIRRLRDLPKALSAPPGSLASRLAVKLPEINIPKIGLEANNANWVMAPAWSGEGVGRVLANGEPPPPPAPPRAESAWPLLTPTTKNSGASEELAPLVAGQSSGSVSPDDAINKVQPQYPAIARKAGASGSVDVRIAISKAGRVVEARAISGHYLLRDAAEEAARQWVFRPAMINGAPVETEVTLTFIFKVLH